MRKGLERTIIILLTLMLVLQFTACGTKSVNMPYVEPETELIIEETTVEKPTEKSETESQRSRSDFRNSNASGAAEQLEAYYVARFDSDSSGHILRDLNSDEQPEMLVFERIAAKNGSAQKTALYYMIVKDNKVVVADMLEQDYCFDNATDDIYDKTTYEYSDYRGEAQEVFVSDDHYICLSRFMCFMAWSAEYDVYQIQNGKFVWIKGITDPGYTAGIGLYLDNEESYDYEDGALYELSPGEPDSKSGKYDSYKQAVTSELNPYGFSLYKNGVDGQGGSGKYQILETESVKKIYGFSLYATLEGFEGMDYGI